jgi:hypothetical protein
VGIHVMAENRPTNELHRAWRHENGSIDLAAELQRIYDSEINVRIGWLWDGGIEVRLADDVNGYLAAETVASAAEILPWLQEAIAHFYPASSYVGSLGPEIRKRGAARLFAPPVAGAQVRPLGSGVRHAR